jgi:uncharacterized DUF497 family protein
MSKITKPNFEWDEKKDAYNRKKHGISFFEAQQAFLDPNRCIAKDLTHSQDELRYYCFGQVLGEIMTVRFTYRGHNIRIIGAGYWRKGKKIYEEAND